MSLRADPVEQPVTLPDGREAVVRIGLRRDDYLPARDLHTVELDLVVDGRIEATVNTLLAPEHDSEALALARKIAEALGSGALEPSAGAIERVALRIP